MNRAGRALRPAVIPILAIVTAFIVGSIFILIGRKKKPLIGYGRD